MQKVTISLSGAEHEILTRLKQQLSKKNPGIVVQKANVESVSSTSGTISILGLTIQVTADELAPTVTDWLYEALKKAPPEAKIDLQINGSRVRSRDELHKLLEKRTNSREKKPGKQ